MLRVSIWAPISHRIGRSKRGEPVDFFLLTISGVPGGGSGVRCVSRGRAENLEIQAGLKLDVQASPEAGQAQACSN